MRNTPARWGLALRTWITTARLRLSDDRGASFVEYAMLVAFIAIVAVGAFSLLGGPVSEGLSAGGDGFQP